MKKLTVFLGILAVLAFGPALSASSAAEQANQKPMAVKQKRVKKINPYADLEPYRSMDFIGEYPGEYARLRASGECVIDLGYGRWESCNSGGSR